MFGTSWAGARVADGNQLGSQPTPWGLAVPYADYQLLRSCSTVQAYPRTVLLYE